MRLKGGQYRFVVGVLSAWVGVRVASVWSGNAVSLKLTEVRINAKPIAHPSLAARRPSLDALRQPTLRAASPVLLPADMDKAPPASGRRQQLLALIAAPQFHAPDTSQPISAGAVPLAVRGVDTFSSARPSPVSGRSPTRWAANAYVFVRPGSGRPSLAAGGTLGGSQAAARIAYQINPDGPVRTAVAARLYAPLASKGAEAALGLDWHPLAAIPLRLSVERRFDLDGKGRNAWSAYAAGGYYLERFGGRLVLDGYGQAGVVGLDRRDRFVDGALRAGRRLPVGSGTATVGAALWGAAQPGASRLDVGPRAAMALPIARETVSVALEGRMRIAGRADPGSGATLTIAFDL